VISAPRLDDERPCKPSHDSSSSISLLGDGQRSSSCHFNI
jgi:hypothetical protein